MNIHAVHSSRSFVVFFFLFFPLLTILPTRNGTLKEVLGLHQLDHSSYLHSLVPAKAALDRMWQCFLSLHSRLRIGRDSLDHLRQGVFVEMLFSSARAQQSVLHRLQ